MNKITLRRSWRTGLFPLPAAHSIRDLSSLTRDQTCSPGVLTTGLPGKPLQKGLKCPDFSSLPEAWLKQAPALLQPTSPPFSDISCVPFNLGHQGVFKDWAIIVRMLNAGWTFTSLNKQKNTIFNKNNSTQYRKERRKEMGTCWMCTSCQMSGKSPLQVIVL